MSARATGSWGAGEAGALRLPASARHAIEEAAARGYPHETCGLLLGRLTQSGAEVLEAIEVRNTHQERARDRYQLDPDGFLRADQKARAMGWDVVGIWHSHPDHPAQPSATDREHAFEGYAYAIVSVEQGSVTALRAWRLQGGDFREVDVLPVASPRRQQEAMP